MSIRKTLLLAIEHDPKTTDELVAETLLSKAQVNNNMKICANDGLVVRESDNGALVYHITPPGLDWIKLHRGEDDSTNDAAGSKDEADIKKILEGVIHDEKMAPATAQSEATATTEINKTADDASSGRITLCGDSFALDSLALTGKKEAFDLGRASFSYHPSFERIMQDMLKLNDMVAIIQSHMKHGISIEIHEKNICLLNDAGDEFECKPHEFTKMIESMTLLAERKLS